MIATAGSISLVALAIVVASLAYLHLRPTGLSPVRNAVSQYGISSFKSGYRVATIAFGVAGAALAFGLNRALTGPGRSLVIVLLGLFALARGAISWFPMDVPGAERTQTGARHGLLAAVAFTGVTAAAFRLGGVLDAQRHWHSLASVSTALGAAMAVLLVSLVVSRSLARAAGALRADRTRFLSRRDRLVRHLFRRVVPRGPEVDVGATPCEQSSEPERQKRPGQSCQWRRTIEANWRRPEAIGPCLLRVRCHFDLETEDVVVISSRAPRPAGSKVASRPPTASCSKSGFAELPLNATAPARVLGASRCLGERRRSRPGTFETYKREEIRKRGSPRHLLLRTR